MVRKIKEEKNKAYQCEECKFLYKDKKWAEKCQEWCKRYHSCNMEITKWAISEK